MLDPILSWHTYLMVLPLVFFAGLVDSIAGGGGLISLPAYWAAGLPPHFVLGNNKFSSVFGTMVATLRYYHGGLIDLKVALLSACFALAGSFLGTKAVLLIDPGFLRYVLVVLVPGVTIFILLNKNLGVHNNSHQTEVRTKFILAGIASAMIGFYDGFFGPGTGAFLILFYTLLLKYDFVTANANTKMVNLASNVAAVITFMAHGKVIYALGIPAAVCGIAGNLLGARMVMNKGAKVIRPIFILVLLLLLAKIIYDMITGQ